MTTDLGRFRNHSRFGSIWLAVAPVFRQQANDSERAVGEYMEFSAEDEGLLGEFLAETREGLANAEDLLMRLEGETHDQESVEALFRFLHTTKGTAGYFDLSRLKTLSHELENVLDRLRSGVLKLDKNVIDLLLAGQDLLASMVDAIEVHRRDDLHDELLEIMIGRLKDLLAGPKVHNEAASILELIDGLRKSLGNAAQSEETLRMLSEIANRMDSGGLKTNAEQIVAAPESAANDRLAEKAGTQAPKADSTPAKPAAKAPKPATPDVAEPERERSREQNDKTMRVPERRVDDFLGYVGSLVRLRQVITGVEKRMAEAVNDIGLMSEVREMAGAFIKVSEELQRSVMSLRLVPVSMILRKVPRLVRDVAVARGKQIQVKIEGESIEIDKSLVEVLEGPIIHMVRNAADHGVESPSARKAAGKPEMGTVTVRVIDTADELRVEISDDGAGINRVRLREKAIQGNLIEANQALTEEAILALLFAPGVSTAEEITDISGRGVGMDVVRRNIEQRGGEIRVQTEDGKGATFRVHLPKSVATAITPAITIRCANLTFAVPMSCVTEVVMLDAVHISTIERTPDGEVMHLRDNVIPLVSLRDTLGLPGQGSADSAVVIFDTERGAYGVKVGEVLDSLDVVVQELGYLAQKFGIFSEGCVLGDGSIALIVDADTVSRHLVVERAQAVTVRSALGHVSELAARARRNARQDNTERFLIYALSDGKQQAVAMHAVIRLETISLADIEYTSGKMCVQYRGAVIRLSNPPSRKIELRDPQPCVVMTDGVSTVGLLVHEVIDVIDTVVHDRRYIGNMGVSETLLIDDHTIEHVDLQAIFPRSVASLAS